MPRLQRGPSPPVPLDPAPSSTGLPARTCCSPRRLLRGKLHLSLTASPSLGPSHPGHTPPRRAWLTSLAAGACPPPQTAVQELVCPCGAGPSHQPGSGLVQEYLGSRRQERGCFKLGFHSPHLPVVSSPNRSQTAGRQTHEDSPYAWQARSLEPDASDHSGPSGSPEAPEQRPEAHFLRWGPARSELRWEAAAAAIG